MPESDDHSCDPGWLAYLKPFSFIVPDGETPWEVSIEEVTRNTFDFGKLARIVDRYPTPLGSEWPMLVCYDGAVALPQVGHLLHKQNAVEFLNHTLCALLLGGVVSEAVSLRDVVWGRLHGPEMIWPVAMGDSVTAQLHARLRTAHGGLFDNLELMHARPIARSHFREAMRKGTSALEQLPKFSPSFLIQGFTYLASQNWSSALANIWISLEQLTDHLWRETFLNASDAHPETDVPGRRKALKEDHRTWSASVRQEILFQRKVFSGTDFRLIFQARQSRNRLVHNGEGVPKEAATAAFSVTLDLIRRITQDDSLGVVALEALKNQRGDHRSSTGRFKLWNTLRPSEPEGG